MRASLARPIAASVMPRSHLVDPDAAVAIRVRDADERAVLQPDQARTIDSFGPEPPGRVDRALAVLRLDGAALRGGQSLVRIARPKTVQPAKPLRALHTLRPNCRLGLLCRLRSLWLR